jgi:hypothetical protein
MHRVPENANAARARGGAAEANGKLDRLLPFSKFAAEPQRPVRLSPTRVAAEEIWGKIWRPVEGGRR